jgi:hypothetical protein
MADSKSKGIWNIIAGVGLLVMGLSGLFGGSIFLGNADPVDIAFDVIGIGLIVYGTVQLARKP